MGHLLSYSLVSGLVMLAMYLAYKLFLARENQHGYNRGVLLSIYLVSFAAVPLMRLMPAAHAPVGSGGVEIGGLQIAAVAEAAPASSPMWGTVLIWIYLAGMAAVGLRTAAIWLKLASVVRHGQKQKREGYTLVVTDDERLAPFSWLGYIVVSRKDMEEGDNAIIAHEMKHVGCRHWADLLLAQAVCIVCWYNPAAWLMREELMLVHEYQADMAVIDSGYDPKQYQLLLIKKAVGSRFPSLANSLNHSQLKKRITMMYKQKSGAGRKLKALALVPTLALALSVAAVPAVSAAVTEISGSGVSAGKVSDNSPKEQIKAQVYKVTNVNNNDGKTSVTIKATGLGNAAVSSGGTFTTSGKTYQANGVDFTLTDGEAVIIVTFPYISEFENSNMIIFVNDEEVPFDLDDFFNKADQAVVVDQPEVMPTYPGGEAAIMQALMQKLTFPDPQREWKKDASGLTLVGFTVMPDGSIADVKRVQSCGYGDLDQIAIDAVKEALTEKWTPGTVGGKPVAVSYSLPVRFKQQ